MADLFKEIQKLGTLRRKEQILDRRASAAKVSRAEQERYVKQLMNDQGLEEGDSIKYKGLRYSPEETVFAKVQDKAKLIPWLRQNDEEALIEEKLRKGELNRIVRERLDNGQPLPPGLGFHTKEFVGITGISTKVNQKQGVNDDSDNESE